MEMIRTWGEFVRFCGCGDIEQTAQFYRDASRVLARCDRGAVGFHTEGCCPGYSDRLVAEILTLSGVIEHGGGIGGSWLTARGREMLDILYRAELVSDPNDEESVALDAACAQIARDTRDGLLATT